MRYIAFMWLAAALAAPASAQTDSGQAENSVIHACFSCDNGREVAMYFFTRQGTAVLVQEGDTVELRQQRSGSGFIYSGGAYVVRGKGRELSIEINRMAPIKCTAQ